MISHSSRSLFALLAVSSATLHAQPTAIDVFDYPAGGELTSADGGYGWSSPWMGDLKLAGEVPGEQVVVTDSLESAAFSSRGLEAAGNRIQALDSNAGLRLFRGLEQSINWGESGTHFLSFLVRWTGSHSTASSRIQLALGEQGSSEVFSGATFVALQSAEVDDQMRLVVRNQGETAFGEDAFPAGQVYFVVARLTSSPGSSLDEICAMVYGPEDSVPDVEPQEWMASAAKARDGQSVLVDLGMFVYKPNREVSFDELRIGDSWDAVTAP